jgi:hypothetical protein
MLSRKQQSSKPLQPFIETRLATHGKGAGEFPAQVSDRQPERLRVEAHDSGLPAIWLYVDPPHTAWVIVDSARDWSKLAYQFGHELGHVLCNSWWPDARPRLPCQKRRGGGRGVLAPRPCAAADVEPLIATGRQPHHPSWRERFAAAPPAPENPTPVEAMAWRSTDIDALLLLKAAFRHNHRRAEWPSRPRTSRARQGSALTAASTAAAEAVAHAIETTVAWPS